jgi:hypothetical protein
VHVQSEVTLLQPAHDAPEREVIDIAEGAFGHPVTEVGAPALQHRVQSAQQVCEPHGEGGNGYLTKITAN